MTIKSLLMLLLAGSLVGLSSCKDDDNDPGPVASCANWSNEVEDEVNAYVAAVETYSNNPTLANCNAFKDAALDYLDALEDVLDCEGITSRDRQEIQNNIEESEEQIQAFDCEQ